MSDDFPVSIRFTEEERKSLEEAMAIKGYRHLSKYIRDRLFGNEAEDARLHDQWMWQQEVSGRLKELERGQQSTHVVLATVVHLLSKKTPTGDISELRAELDHALQMRITPDRLLALLEPKLQASLAKILEAQDAAA